MLKCPRCGADLSDETGTLSSDWSENDLTEVTFECWRCTGSLVLKVEYNFDDAIVAVNEWRIAQRRKYVEQREQKKLQERAQKMKERSNT